MSINVKTSDGELKPLVGTYKGAAGVSPEISENLNNSDKIYKLDITDVNGSFTTPNLIGATGPQGEKGVTGAQGIQGPRGAQGEKGDIGPTGEAGLSPILTENADNSDTVYRLDITDVNGTFSTPNLVGKQGPQGIQGEQGPQGEQGIQGPVGVSPTLVENANNTDDSYKLDITDANGTFTTPNLIGRQGIQGIQGEQGPQGEQGIQGIQGIQGPRGNDGYPFLIYKEYTSLDEFDPSHFPEIGLMFMVRDGSTENIPVYRYTGETSNPYSHTTDMSTAEGLKGDKGDKGDQGEQGIQGEKGADGVTYTPAIGTITTVNSDSDASADVVVDTEAKTATFNFSIPRGVQGIQGIQGEQGPQGEKGIDGSTYTPAIGTVSTVNAASEASANIVLDNDNKIAQFNFSIPRGAQGLQGLQGPKGEQGEIGADGVDGTTYIPAIGTITTVESSADASATVTLDEENKQAVFNFNIPKGVAVEKIEFTSSTLGDEAGIASATDTYTITYTDGSTSTYEVYNGKDCDVQIDDINEVSDSTVWSSKKTSGEIDKITYSTDANECIPALMKTARYNLINTSANVPNSNYSWVLTAEHIKLSTGQYYRIIQDINGTKSDGGTIKYTRTATSTDDVTWTWTDWVVDALISDTTSSATNTYSSAKIDKKFAPRHFGTDNKTLWLKLQLGAMTTHEPITVTDQYGGQIKILGMYDLSTYKSVKVIRLSYGDWNTHSGTDVSTTTSGDGNYKIRRLFYCPDDNNYYLEIRQYSYITVEGAPDATMVMNLPAEESAMTLIPESVFITKSDLATQTANRQVKTFDNSGSSAEKWYKICSALAIGIGCNIKLTASRADSTATVQYFSAVFRDSLYRYTSSYISRERTVYASTLIAEYSAYIIADANNDIWVHVPSYGKAIIEVDTRAITIDGTAGTPVEDYVYSSFEHQYDGKINDSATNTDSTWSSSKIASEIGAKITKTQYRGSRSIDISTGGKLTLIYSSEYASQAGCYMLLSNFNTEPLLIELGRNNIGQFSVTATHKSQNVDTITVTAAGDDYSWCVLQF